MDSDDDGRQWAEYVNLDPSLGIVISAKLATLHELKTIYNLEDLYNLLEVCAVDRHNARVAATPKED